MGRLSFFEALDALERGDLDAAMACQRGRSRAHAALNKLVRHQFKMRIRIHWRSNERFPRWRPGQF